jgi:hypothetical protein
MSKILKTNFIRNNKVVFFNLNICHWIKIIPITNWSEDDKPREKLMLKGATLSDAELIAILIGSK